MTRLGRGVVLASLLAASRAKLAPDGAREFVGSEPVAGGRARWDLACWPDEDGASPGCRPPPAGASCGRALLDGFASADEVLALRALAEKGMRAGGAGDVTGGPTIMDADSGFTMSPGAKARERPLLSRNVPAL